MGRNTSRSVVAALVTGLICSAVVCEAGQTSPARRRTPQSVRLYVFDCGTLHIADNGRFRLKVEEVATSDLSVACLLVAHPKGTLIWETGAIPDADWKPTAGAVARHVTLPDAQQRDVTMIKPLKAQLTEIGFSPA